MPIHSLSTALLNQLSQLRSKSCTSKQRAVSERVFCRVSLFSSSQAGAKVTDHKMSRRSSEAAALASDRMYSEMRRHSTVTDMRRQRQIAQDDVLAQEEKERATQLEAQPEPAREQVRLTAVATESRSATACQWASLPARFVDTTTTTTSPAPSATVIVCSPLAPCPILFASGEARASGCHRRAEAHS
jgi:hypothetical protein